MAHLRQLEFHAAAAAQMRRTAMRPRFELGWAAWSDGGYDVAAAHFRQVRHHCCVFKGKKQVKVNMSSNI